MKVSNIQKQPIGRGNFIKYLNPSSLIQPKANRNRTQTSNIHCRSMQQLDLNPSMASHSSISKQNLKTNIHHSSLFSQKDNNKSDKEPSKSKSLSKFIAFFQNSNILNSSQTKKDNDLKRKNYNGFSYDLKISANPNTCNKKILKKKDKQNVNYQTLSSQRELNIINPSKSPFVAKNQNSNSNLKSGNQTQQILLTKMKDLVEQQKRKQIQYCNRIQELQIKNKELSEQKQQFQNQIQSLIHKLNSSEAKIKELQIKNKEYQERNRQISNKQQRNVNKQSREQDMVIKSLKKVINEQLNKIIELQRYKIQNQYLKEKLGHQQDQSLYQSKVSNNEYSFEQDLQYKHKKTSLSSSSDIKANQKYFDIISKQNFKKANKIKQNNDNEKQKADNKHFKSFFQIEESPISADDNLMRFFKPSETKRSQGKNKSQKTDDKKEGHNMIKITEAQSSFSRQAIQQVNEENQDNQIYEQKNGNLRKNFDEQQGLREEQDSILEEVDQYLTKWRNKP